MASPPMHRNPHSPGGCSSYLFSDSVEESVVLNSRECQNLKIKMLLLKPLSIVFSMGYYIYCVYLTLMGY